MATFKLPTSELRKLREYKKKLLEQQRKLDRGEIEDIPIHESIAKSSGISQILKTLEPKGEQIGTDFKGAITTAGGRRLPLSEPVHEKKDPTRQSFTDAFKIASEYDISTKGLKPPKEKLTTAEELKSRNLLKKWGIEYDESLKPKANIEAGSTQIWPHELDQFQDEANEVLGKKPLTGDEYKAKKLLEKWDIEQDIGLDHKANVIAGYDKVADGDKDQYLEEANKLFAKPEKKEKPRLSEQQARNNLNRAVIKINKIKGKIEEGLNKSGDEKELAFISRKFNEWLEFIPEEDREEYLQDIGEPSATGVAIGTEALKETSRPSLDSFWSQ